MNVPLITYPYVVWEQVLLKVCYVICVPRKFHEYTARANAHANAHAHARVHSYTYTYTDIHKYIHMGKWWHKYVSHDGGKNSSLAK